MEKSLQTWPERIPNLPCAYYTIDDQGYITFFNEAAAALWGRTPEPGRDKWSAAHKLYAHNGSPLSPAQSPAALALRNNREIKDHQLIVQRPDGAKRRVLGNAAPIHDATGKATGAAVVLVDITDSVNAESAKTSEKQHALTESEERYHKMIAEVEDYAILLLNPEGVIQNWNVGAERIKGYKEHEIVGRHFRVFYTPADREAKLPETLIARAAREGKAIHEGWRQRKDGTLFWGSIVITALHDSAGDVIGFSKVTRDLTARRVAEEKLKRYSQELEFQNRELQQFAYAAAHDMKEPLRKLRIYSSFLLDSMHGRLSEKEATYLQRAMDAAARMQMLIDDLLTYSRASSNGAAHLEVDLRTVVGEALTTYDDLIEETKARVELPPLPVVWGVAFQLRQLFENLVGNALKYRDPNRPPVIRIHCEKGLYPPDANTSHPPPAAGSLSLPDGNTSQPPADANLPLPGEYYKITVADNGIGFEEAKAARIFDIFQRLDTPGKRSGTGIGLAIAKRVVQNHHGYMFANGIPGVGATFTIYLPVRQDQPSR